MRKLFAVLLVAATASANDISYRSLQSFTAATPLHDRGLHGEGQIVAVLDTGLDYSSCYFAEPGNAPPPINTGSPLGGLDWQNVDYSRRKVIAYNFLYSCDQFPGARGCENPGDLANAYDNQGHGTHAAGSIAGDKGALIAHDYGDAIATGAKLVIQDGGFIGGDNCSHRPGFGCPVNLTPILDQAYRQGARIHSNSWGDRQNTGQGAAAPTANYPASARDVDAFVHSHPDMLVVFNTGNYTPNGTPPASTLSAPGSAKNTLQVGGSRGYRGQTDEVIAGYSLVGPTRDGRIKPDVVGPAWVDGADARVILNSGSLDPNCFSTPQGGTSWSSPSVAGAAALVRQYYTEGWYPSGARNNANRMTPSAALLKATIIASARPLTSLAVVNSAGALRPVPAQPVPSYEQGFGFPVLDDALYFPGDRLRLRVSDVAPGLAQAETATMQLDVRAGAKFRVVLVWTDPAGTAVPVNDTRPQLVNDLDLRVVGPGGAAVWGNESLHPGQPDRLNNVEAVILAAPAAGIYTISVTANRINTGARQSYALVVTGDLADEAAAPARRRAIRR